MDHPLRRPEKKTFASPAPEGAAAPRRPAADASPPPARRPAAPPRRAHARADAPLLAALLASFEGLTRTKAKSLLAHGAVRLNGRADLRHDTPVAAGDELALLPAPPPEERGRAARTLPFPLLFEDDDLVVIDKPHGLLTVATDKGGDRTAHRLLGEHAEAEGWPAARVFVVHRLDRETSGVLVFAKTEEAKHALQGRWAETEKEYVAVVEGVPDPPEGRLVHHLYEDTGIGLRVHVVAAGRPGAVEAITAYRVVAQGNGRALLAVTIATGRRHQIRVQLAAAGHPVCGDERYGRKAPPGRRDGADAPRAPRRLALHAARLVIPHPATGERLAFTSPTPVELTRLLRAPAPARAFAARPASGRPPRPPRRG